MAIIFTHIRGRNIKGSLKCCLSVNELSTQINAFDCSELKQYFLITFSTLVVLTVAQMHHFFYGE